MSILPLTVPPKKLAQTISSTATSMKLNNIEGWNGNDLTPGDFGTEAFAVLINLTRTQIEIIKIDPATIADAAITITARGLDYLGGETPDPSRQYAWASNETIVQLGTDAPQLFRDFMSESNPATVTALHQYDTLPQSTETPTNDEDFTTKAYVDGLTEPAVTYPINQVAHGFVVGDVIRISGVNTFAKAQADSPANAEVVGIVTNVVDVDNFEFVSEGVVTTGVPVFAAGTVLFLSRTTAGALVDTDTTTIGEVSFPLAVVSESGVRMYFHKYRPAVINSISGNPIASETVAGMVEQATPTQVVNKDDVGETGAPLFVVPSLLPDSAITQVAEIMKGEDGTTTPVAMGLTKTNRAYPVQQWTKSFGGFLKTDESLVSNEASYLGSGGINHATAATTIPVVAPAGTNRYLLIYIWTYRTATPPATVTWNGLPLTLLREINVASDVAQIWGVAIGDSVSSQAIDATTTGWGTTTGNTRYGLFAVYDNVDQASPLSRYYLNQFTGGTQSVSLLNTDDGYNTFVAMARGVSGVLTGDTGTTLRAATSHCQIGDVTRAEETTFQMTNNDGLAVVSLQSASVPDTATLQVSGIVDGFTGLTVGARYYADTDGAITPTPTGIFIGRATAADKLLIDPTTSFIGAKVYQDVASSVPAYNTKTACTFNVVQFDTDNFHDLTAPTRLTVPSAGMYLIGGTVVAAGNNYGVKAIIRKNGSTELAVSGISDGYGVLAGNTVSVLTFLDAGDYVELTTQTQSGSTSTSANESTNFWIKSINN